MDDIRAGLVSIGGEPERERIMVPMQLGSATVYIIGSPELASVIEDDRIRPVAPISPQQAFQSAGEFLHECVRIIGEKVETLADKSRPNEVTVEFSLSFEVKGKASLIPVFVTGESATKTGLNVKAVWKRDRL